MKISFLLLLCLLHGTLAQSCSSEGEIRLVGGRDGGEGRLEFCRNGQWGTVCNQDWDLMDGMVACRELDPAVNLSLIATDVFFPGGDSAQVIHLMDVDCTGNETRLSDCPALDFDAGSMCDSSRAVGLICNVPQPECNSTDVRLAGGDSSSDGRLEYCVGGRWGTVCNTDFSVTDATVVCNQQQFPSTDFAPLLLGSFFSPLPTFPEGVVRPIVLSGVQCSGTESELSECDRAEFISSCSRMMDVGIHCGCPNNYELRLAESLEGDENEGRIEFCLNGEWRILCQNGVDIPDITVMCRELGYEPINVGSLLPGDFNSFVFFDRGGSSHLMYDFEFQCSGNESRLQDCGQVALTETCATPGIGISCPLNAVSECTFGSIRLQDGLLSNQIGRVEVCANGRWGLVCRDDWGIPDATVACRQLGYEGAGIPLQDPTRFGNELEADFLLDNLNCTGDEETLFACPHPGITIQDGCFLPFADASLICGTTEDRCPGGVFNSSTVETVVPTRGQTLEVQEFGTCEPYRGQPDLCRDFIAEDAYIFIIDDADNPDISQDTIITALNVVAPFISTTEEQCQELVSNFLCNYFFPSCGNEEGVHLPLALCPEECAYVSQDCEEIWMGVMGTLGQLEDIPAVNCSASSSRFRGLSACCVSAGIIIPPPTSPVLPTTTMGLSGPSSGIEDLVAPLAGGIIAAIAMIVIVLVVIVICLFMTNIKRKKIVKEIQMEVLTNPTRVSEASPIPPPQDQPDVCSPLAKSGSISPSPSPTNFKLRNGSSKKVVPNAYSSIFTSGSEKGEELDFSAPLLNPLSASGKSSNRISSSMIRELSSDMVIPYCRLNLLDCIGQGEFGVVYKAEYTQPTEDDGYDINTVAVKTLKGFFDKDKVDSIMDESLKMKHFDHPNVLGLTGVCLDAGPAPYIVMPYMANGSLLHYLKKERKDIVLSPEVDDDVKVDIRKRLTIMCLQIANGMVYLAEEKFVHRDLAARNCMIDLHFVIKISDFGLSEDVYSKNYFRQCDDNSIKLPVKWMAPESLNDGVFSEKTDVWSFGVTCWEVFSGGKTPYPGVDPLQLSVMLDQNKRLNKPVNAACSDEIHQLMMQCWSTDPNKRPAFNDIARTLSGYIETLAGYLDMNFNPFSSPTQERKSSLENGISNDVLKYPEQLAALYDNIPRTKVRSPRASPRASPLPSPSAMNANRGFTNNPPVQIQIDSPPPNF